ncbi:MAG: hypothetical protein IJ630_03680 [Treponema sp.]|nr:hypothetical protein [Treponema sp.]
MTEKMTFEDFWKENYEKEFSTSEPYYGIASYAFEKGQENCNCVHTDNSKVIAELAAQIEKIKCCSNCKNCKRKFIKENVFENTCKVEHCKNYDKWEMKK